jgi:hypothetical protein
VLVERNLERFVYVLHRLACTCIIVPSNELSLNGY